MALTEYFASRVTGAATQTVAVQMNNFKFKSLHNVIVCAYKKVAEHICVRDKEGFCHSLRCAL